ncbi:MAG: hypothetical protein PHS60_18030 [Zavarzinia sp.]|nr:hypothetical protein [Zavarzinia sp.]
MARDPALEARVVAWLDKRADAGPRAMFGGLAWFLRGNLLCCASDRGLMARLGKGREAWALARPGIEIMTGARPMAGWVLAAPGALDEEAGRRLIDAALAFVGALPPK